MSKTKTYDCVNTVKKDGDLFFPGDEVELTDAQAKKHLANGSIVEPGAAPKPQTAASVDDLDDLTVGELKEKAAELGIDLDDVEGSGSSGNVVKDDIVEAIRVQLAVG